VKLDQSFVRNVIASKNDALVVSTVVSMCKSLKHRVIAEGVETAKQSAFLQSAGCDEGQGFYFSGPLDPWAFAKLLLTDLVLPAKTEPYGRGHEAAATSY
jgi:EAL domain-containing protein (putative c-di-GMP-specific phosphodiesterase class I)